MPPAFPPTLREVLLRRRSFGILALALIVAGVFAWLGQWQLGSAIDTDPPAPGITEDVRELSDVLQPAEYLPEPLVGQSVVTSGTWIADDFIIVSARYNDDVEGFWVTGQLRVAERTSIAVALGWAPDRESAEAAVDELQSGLSDAPVDLAGRIISDEGTALPGPGDPFQLSRMSPAALLSQWHDTDQLDVYRPYLASFDAPDSLENIASGAPDELSAINWLNIFYAVEWIVFAGFAFYIWYRLGKDAWEIEVEEFEDRAAK